MYLPPDLRKKLLEYLDSCAEADKQAQQQQQRPRAEPTQDESEGTR